MTDDLRPTFLAAEFDDAPVAADHDHEDEVFEDEVFADEAPAPAVSATHATAVVEVLARALSEEPDAISVEQGYDRARDAVTLSIQCA